MPGPPQPSDKDRSLHELANVPFPTLMQVLRGEQVMCQSVLSFPRFAPGETQREHPIMGCKRPVMEPGEEGAVVTSLMVDFGSPYVAVAHVKKEMCRQLVELCTLALGLSKVLQLRWRLATNLFW